MTIITISRQYGSGGDEIADRVCQLLGYRKFDKNLIIEAAAAEGLSEQEIVDYSEENHKVRGFLDRLLGREPVVGQTRVWKEKPTGERVVEASSLSDEAAYTLVRKAILSACESGNLVIVGRGGQALLRDCPAALHVRVEAPLETRIQRLKGPMKIERQDFSAAIESRRAAQDIITQRDTASADYLRRFYNIEWDDPMLYHLIINTGRMTIEQGAQTVARLAPDFHIEEKISQEAVGL